MYLLSLVISFSLQAAELPASLNNSYLFTHYSDYSVQEYNDDISICFKINAKSKQALSTYDSCRLTPNGQTTPLNSSIGECKRSTTTKAYFFNSLNDCKAARADIAGGASS